MNMVANFSNLQNSQTFFTFTKLTIDTVVNELMKLQILSRTSGETCRSAVLVVEPVALLQRFELLSYNTCEGGANFATGQGGLRHASGKQVHVVWRSGRTLMGKCLTKVRTLVLNDMFEIQYGLFLNVLNLTIKKEL